MKSSQFRWQKYKSDFLKANHCTAEEFEAAYIVFMESNPNMRAYRQFARKYRIAILPEPNLPEEVRVKLSVSISAIKVMAKTFEQSLSTVREILSVS